MGARLQPVAGDAFERSTSQFEEIREFAGSGKADTMTQSELERELEVRVRELKRQLLQDHLDRREGGRALEAVTDAEGQERPVEREHERTLRTTFGTVKVARFGYGSDGAESLHPLDAELNLPPDGYSLELRRQMAREAARGSFGEAVEAIHQTTGVQVPKRQAEELAVRAAEDFDEYYAAKQALGTLEPAEEPVLVLSLDGKGIVMRPEDLREATRKKAVARKPHLTARLAPGEKPHAKRMATVATVYTVDRHVRTPQEVFPPPGPHRVPPPPRPNLASKRVWASVEEEMEDVVAAMFLEAASRDPEHARECRTPDIARSGTPRARPRFVWGTNGWRPGRVRFPKAAGAPGSGSRPVDTVEVGLLALQLRPQEQSHRPHGPAATGCHGRAREACPLETLKSHPENSTEKGLFHRGWRV